jgi:SNF2 family DNA or RNA helicase
MDADKEFEKIVDQQMDPKAILAEMQALKESLAPVAEAIAEAAKMKDAYKSEIDDHMKIVSDLRTKQSEIDASVFDARRKMRELERQINAASTRYDQALANEELRKRYAELSDEFDELTKGAPWREFAFDHQITGAKKLAAAKRAILADKRGLGKSLTSLIYCDMAQAKRVLAIVPNDTVGNYLREVNHWTKDPHTDKSYRNPITLAGLNKGERDMVMTGILPYLDHFFVVLNYEAWRRDAEFIENLLSLQIDTIILDEAHTAKNTKTKTYQGIRRLLTGPNKCSKCGSANINSTGGAPICKDCLHQPDDFFEFNSVQNVLPMTGTPIMNRPQDLYALLSIIDPVDFHSEYRFLSAYCMQSWDNKWRFRPGGLDSLTKQLASRFVMRDRKSAGVIIPPQEIQYYELTLDPEKYPNQYQTAAALNQRAMLLLNDNQVLPLPYVLQLITRKRQSMTWAQGIEFKDRDGVVVYKADCDESIKLDKVIDNVNTDNGPVGLLPELIGEYDPDINRWIDGERVIVFSAFNAPLHELARRLKQARIPFAMMTGETTPEQRDEVALDFDIKSASPTDYKYQVLLANYSVGGVGLNLNAASQIIAIDEMWSPGRQDQAFGRVDRLGQTRETTVHVLRVKGTVDTWMAALIEDKGQMIQGFESSLDLQAEFRKAIEEGNF